MSESERGWMREADRNLKFAFLVVFVVIALELAWFLFVGPSEYGTRDCSQDASKCDLPWWDSAAFWTAAFTFFLTISTALLWWQTRRLAKGAESQTEQVASAITEMARSADATVDLATAANKSAEIAEKMLQGAERPVIYVSAPGKFSPKVDQLGRPQYAVSIENIGRHPAVIEIAHANFVVQLESDPPKFDADLPDETGCIPTSMGEIVIKPGAPPQTIMFMRSSGLTEKEQSSLDNCTAFGFLRVTLSYSDPIGVARQSVFIFARIPESLVDDGPKLYALLHRDYVLGNTTDEQESAKRNVVSAYLTVVQQIALRAKAATKDGNKGTT